jgi:predicted enzyme involved in methoxymalonyl-ACP biosynthesis
VEHSFLTYVIQIAMASDLFECVCLYNRTERNAPAGVVFASMGFERRLNPGLANVEHQVISTQANLPTRLPVKVQDSVSLIKQLRLIKEHMSPSAPINRAT